jgi:hypothetical protein
MSKPVSAITAILLLSVPSIAAAKDKLEPSVQSVLACESISSDEARLQCYDQAIVPLKQALSRGSMVLKENKGPLALGGVVKASGKSGENRFWVVFENGDRWSVVTAKARREAPKLGTNLKLKKTFFGNYWISGPGWPESDATFLGHGS